MDDPRAKPKATTFIPTKRPRLEKERFLILFFSGVKITAFLSDETEKNLPFLFFPRRENGRKKFLLRHAEQIKDFSNFLWTGKCIENIYVLLPFIYISAADEDILNCWKKFLGRPKKWYFFVAPLSFILNERRRSNSAVWSSSCRAYTYNSTRSTVCTG